MNALKEMPVGKAAITAGLALLVIVITAIFAEFYVFPTLIVKGSPTEITKSFTENRGLFILGLFSYTTAFIFDVVVAWALYAFFIPVNRTLSLFTGWSRLVYTIIALVSLLNLVTILQLTGDSNSLFQLDDRELESQVMIAWRSFRYQWDFGFAFFGIHLALLGYLSLKAKYVPNIMGILLLLGGIGYFIEYTLKPYLFPGVNTEFLMITFFGEIVFMLWLLIRGGRIRPEEN